MFFFFFFVLSVFLNIFLHKKKKRAWTEFCVAVAIFDILNGESCFCLAAEAASAPPSLGPSPTIVFFNGLVVFRRDERGGWAEGETASCFFFFFFSILAFQVVKLSCSGSNFLF